MAKVIPYYKVFITPDFETGDGRSGFVACVPKLGIADDGATVEEALANVRSLIKFHLECLIAEGEAIPAPDAEDSFVTSATVNLSAGQARKFQELASV